MHILDLDQLIAAGRERLADWRWAEKLRGQLGQGTTVNCNVIAPLWLRPSWGKGEDSTRASLCVTSDFDCVTIPPV